MPTSKKKQRVKENKMEKENYINIGTSVLSEESLIAAKESLRRQMSDAQAGALAKAMGQLKANAAVRLFNNAYNTQDGAIYYDPDTQTYWSSEKIFKEKEAERKKELEPLFPITQDNPFQYFKDSMVKLEPGQIKNRIKEIREQRKLAVKNGGWNWHEATSQVRWVTTAASHISNGDLVVRAL